MSYPIVMLIETKKRTFRTDVTNINFRRNKIDFQAKEETKHLKLQVKAENVQSDVMVGPVVRVFELFVILEF